MDSAQPTTIEVRKLRLDANNPRLPEHLQGANEEELLKYLYLNTALDELATSFLDNGFFAHEPLIISKENVDGVHTVLEGNRRFAALAILLHLETAEAADIEFSVEPTPTGEQLERLDNVPCFMVESPEDVHRFLGFRHIGGIKTWSAEAKARYLLAEVRRAHRQDRERNPFTTVGRAVGSNTQGVRNPYVAMRILIYGREQFGIDIADIQRHRFGVWNRGMNSRDLRDYIGFGSARTFAEVESALEALSEPKLREVLRDMTPVGMYGSPVELMFQQDGNRTSRSDPGQQFWGRFRPSGRNRLLRCHNAAAPEPRSDPEPATLNDN